MQWHHNGVPVHERYKRRSVVKSANLCCTCHFYPLLSLKIRRNPAISCCFKVKTACLFHCHMDNRRNKFTFTMKFFLCPPCFFVPKLKQLSLLFYSYTYRKKGLPCVSEMHHAMNIFHLSLKSEYFFSFVAFLNSQNMPEPEVKL